MEMSSAETEKTGCERGSLKRMLGSDSRRSSFEDNFIEMSGKHQAIVKLAAKCIGPNFRAECLSEDTNM